MPSPDYLRLKIRDVVPYGGGYRYTFKEDGARVEGGNYDAWIARIRAHYERNNYPMPEDWKEQAEDQLCRLLPEGLCTYPDGSKPEFFVNLQFNLHDAIHGTQVLGRWIASGFDLVPQEVAEERGRTCASCYANVHLPGCGSCLGFANHVAQVVGVDKKLKSDPYLEGRSCAYCHCSSRANAWVPVEISKVGVSPEALEAMPSWCWKKRDIALLTENA